MRCPNCGAETNEPVCSLCGFTIETNEAVNEQMMQENDGGGFKLVEPDNTNTNAGSYGQPAQNMNAGVYGQPAQNMNPYGAPDMNGYADLESQPYDATNMGNGYSYDSSYSSPKKKSSGGIIGIIVAVAVVAVALLWFFVFRENGAKKSEELIGTFMEAIQAGDTEAITSVVDPECVADEDIDQFTAAFEVIKAFGIEYTIDYNINSTEKASEGTVKSMCGQIYGDASVAKKIKKAYVVSVSYTMTMSYAGEEESDSQTMNMICYKKDGNWYIGGYGEE